MGVSTKLLKKFQMQGRREEETGAYYVVREDFRQPRTPQMDFFSSLLVLGPVQPQGLQELIVEGRFVG